MPASLRSLKLPDPSFDQERRVPSVSWLVGMALRQAAEGFVSVAWAEVETIETMPATAWDRTETDKRHTGFIAERTFRCRNKHQDTLQ